MTNLTTDDFYNEIQHAAQTTAPLFNLYGWTWYDNDTPPTINNIELTITRLVEGALDSFNNSDEEYPEATCSTGRFIVRIKQYEGERELTINLNLASKSQFKNWTF